MNICWIIPKIIKKKFNISWLNVNEKLKMPKVFKEDEDASMEQG